MTNESLNILDNVLGITDVVETKTSTVTLPEVKVPEEVDNDLILRIKLIINKLSRTS